MTLRYGFKTWLKDVLSGLRLGKAMEIKTLCE